MPEYYLVPKRAARAWPWLGRSVQWLEARVFQFLFWLIGRLSPERASAWSAALFGALGSHGDKARKADLIDAVGDLRAKVRSVISRRIRGLAPRYSAGDIPQPGQIRRGVDQTGADLARA